MFLFFIAFGAVGYFIGTKAPLLVQALTIGAAWLYCINQRRFEEIAAIFPYICLTCLIGGVALGDIVYALVHPDRVKVGALADALRWLLVP